MNDRTNERLEKLRRASAGVRPSAGFGDRVMRAVTRPSGELTGELTGALSGELFGGAVSTSGFWQVTSRLRFVGIAALAAIGTLFVAIQSDSEADDLVASSYASPEVDW